MKKNKKVEVSFYVGLPGSGKTTLLSLKKDGFFIDDFSLNIEKIEDFKKSNKNKLYIADPMLCLTTKEKAEELINNKLSYFDIDYKWCFYENDLPNCLRNIKRREDERKISENFMSHLSKRYKELHGESLINAIPVYKGE